jgi:hypothetical protein
VGVAGDEHDNGRLRATRSQKPPVSFALVVEIGGEMGRLQPGDEIVQNGLVDVDGEWLKWLTSLGSRHRDVPSASLIGQDRVGWVSGENTCAPIL